MHGGSAPLPTAWAQRLQRRATGWRACACGPALWAWSPRFFSCLLVPQMLLPRKHLSHSFRFVPAKRWQMSKQLTGRVSSVPAPNSSRQKGNKDLEVGRLDSSEQAVHEPGPHASCRNRKRVWEGFPPNRTAPERSGSPALTPGREFRISGFSSGRGVWSLWTECCLGIRVLSLLLRDTMWLGLHSSRSHHCPEEGVPLILAFLCTCALSWSLSHSYTPLSL